MKVKEITVTAGLKLSKNYQTCESTVSITAEVSNDCYREDFENLSEVVHDMVNQDIKVSLDSLKEYN